MMKAPGQLHIEFTGNPNIPWHGLT